MAEVSPESRRASHGGCLHATPYQRAVESHLNPGVHLTGAACRKLRHRLAILVPDLKRVALTGRIDKLPSLGVGDQQGSKHLGVVQTRR